MDETSDLSEALLEAVEVGNASRVAELLARGADPNAFVEHSPGRRVTVLERAAARGSMDIVTALLDAGAELTWSHALSLAAESGHLEVIRLLVDRGANLAWGALDSAVAAGQFDAARLLLDCGAAPDWEAIHAAAGSKSLNSMLRLLLERGADPNTEGFEAVTPLIIASGRHGSLGAVRMLLNAGANVHHRCDDGDNALMFAAAYRECGDAEDILPTLLEAGADPNALNDEPSVITSALIAAVEHGNASNAGVLLHHGADPDITDCRGVTPVLTAVRTLNLPVLRSLVDAGANVSVRNPDSPTDTSEHVINLARRQCVELLYVLGDATGAAALRALAEVE